MEFAIATTSGVPIYQQLMAQICAAIARGRLRPDTRLPSVRELSQTLVVNPNTVARAYTELEREGTLYTRPGLGVFVSRASAPVSKKQRQEKVSASVDSLLVDAVRLGFSADEILDFVQERMKQFHWNSAAVVT